MNQPPDTDARDETLAALLAVPPLDEVTRHRLVRDALARPAPRSSRWLQVASVAAALLIGAAVGTVLVNDRAPDDTTTAQRAPSASDELDSLESVPAAGGDLSSGPITPLGDLGDVTKPAQLRDSVDDAFQQAAGPSEAQAVTGYPCGSTAPGTFGLVAASALGTGTYGGEAVTVVVGTSPEGEALAVVVRATDCTAIVSVRLPKG